MTIHRYFLFLGLIPLWVSCGKSPSQQAGGEDFPNSLTAWGDTVWQRLGNLGGWNEGLGLPGNVSPDPSLAVPAAPATIATNSGPILARTANLRIAASTDILYRDTAQGVLLVTVHTPGVAVETFDTIALPWTGVLPVDDGNLDILWIRGKRVFSLGGVEWYAAWDGDGDGLLHASLGCSPIVTVGCQWALMHTYREFLNGRIQSDSMLISSGPSRDYDLEADNGMRWARSLLLSAQGDTLRWISATPRDSNGWVQEPTLGDSSWIWWREIQTLVGGGYKRAHAGFVHYPADTLRNQVFYLREEKEFPAGGRIILELEQQGDSLHAFAEGDTLWAYRQRIPPLLVQTDTIIERFAFLAGPGLQESRNQMLEISLERRLPTEYRAFDRMDFRSREPLLSGEEPKNGEFLFIRVRQADSLWMSGEIYPEGIRAIIVLNDTLRDTLDWRPE